MSRRLDYITALTLFVSAAVAQPTVAAPAPPPAAVSNATAAAATTAGSSAQECSALAALSLSDVTVISATLFPGGTFTPPYPPRSTRP